MAVLKNFDPYLPAKILIFISLVYFYGLFTAIQIALGFSLTFMTLLYIFFGYKPLIGAELAFYANRSRPTNVIGVMHLEGTNYDDILALLRKLPYMKSNERLRCKIVKVLGENYWTPPMPTINLEKHIHILKPFIKQFKSQQDIADFAAEIIDIPFSMERPMWEVYMGNYKSKETIVIFKVNHSFTDGLSAINCLIGNIADDYKGLVHRLPVIPWSKKVLTVIIFPFYSLYLLAKVILSCKDETIFSDRSRILDNSVTMSKKLSLTKVKELAKMNNSTINDVLTSGTLLAIKRYMQKYGNEKHWNADFIKVGFPAIMKENSKGLQAITLEPKLTVLYVDLPLPSNECLARNKNSVIPSCFVASVSKIMTRLKNSFEPLVTFYLSELLLPIIPFELASLFLCYSSDKMSFTLSNIAGCPNKIHINKREVKSLYCIPPNYNGIPFCLIVTSYENEMKIVNMSNQMDKEQLKYMTEKLFQILA